MSKVLEYPFVRRVIDTKITGELVRAMFADSAWFLLLKLAN